ncbi:MAG: hypothetical protein ACK5TU_00640 [Cyclobacteriaceae bacterium]
MIDKLIVFSVRNKLFVGLMVLAIIAWGSFSLSKRSMPFRMLPAIR